MTRNLFRKVVSVVASLAIAVAFIPIAPAVVGGTEEAQAASKPTITVTRAASGKLTMKKGSTYKLGAKVSKGKLKYKSSKPKVVKVSSKGKLTAKKKGKAVITIKGKKVTKKIKVTVVSSKKFKKVKKIKAKALKKTLTVGQNTRVTVKFTPKKPSNKNVTYKSSNKSVATVDAYGKVVAKKAGSVKITVKSCDKKSAKSTVKIKVVAKKTTAKKAATHTDSSDGYVGYDDPDQEVPHDTSLDKYSDADEEEPDEEVMTPMDLDKDYENTVEYRSGVKALSAVAWEDNGDTYTVDPETLSGETLEVGDRVVFEPTVAHPEGAWFVVEGLSDDGTEITIGDPAEYEIQDDDGDEGNDGEGGDDPAPDDENNDENYDDDYDYYYDDEDERIDYSEELAQSLPYENLDVETLGGVQENGFVPAEGVEILETETVDVEDETGQGEDEDDDGNLDDEDDNTVIELGEDSDGGENGGADSDAPRTARQDNTPLGIGGEATVKLTKFKIKVKNFAFSVQPSANIKVDIDWFSINEIYAAVTMKEELSGKLEISTESDSIKLGDFYFGTSIPGLFLELTTYLNIDASGEIKITFGASQTLGFSYRQGQPKLVKECNAGDVKMDVEGTVSVGLDETASLNALSKKIVDISAGGDIELAWEDFKVRKTGDTCSDLNLSFACGVAIGKHDSLCHDFGISFERELAKIRIKSWHIENSKFVKRCNFDKGTAEGYVKDASNGKGIKATVKVYTDKACTKECTASNNGMKMLQATDGWYKFEIFAGTYYVKVTHPSYNSDVKKITVQKEANVHAGTSVLVKNATTTGSGGSGSTSTSSNTYRIVLTWGKNPLDLDSHYRSGGTHVFYQEMSGGNASLDVDDTQSYGPETITVTNLGNGFTYAVHDYTNASSKGASTALSNSGANVKVYKGSTKLKEYNITKKKRGTLWTVFSIDKNGTITKLNKMSYEKNSANVGA